MGNRSVFFMTVTMGFVGMLFAGALADWIFPFVYNVGLAGFRDSYIGWLLLGGIVALDATRTKPSPSGVSGVGVSRSMSRPDGERGL